MDLRVSLYRLTLGLVVAEFVYLAVWVWVECAARFDLAGSEWVPAGLAASLSLIDWRLDMLFGFEAVISGLSAFLLVRRNHFVLVTYALLMLCTQLDWVMMSYSPVERPANLGVMGLVFQTMTLLLLVAVCTGGRPRRVL